MKNILSVENIEKYYGNKDNITKVIDNINLKVDTVVRQHCLIAYQL